MKIVALVFLVMFFVVKVFVYLMTLLSKKGYTNDYSSMLTIVLPIMSVFMYAGCYYVMASSLVGFACTFAFAWLLLIVCIIAVHFRRYASILIITDDLCKGYNIAERVVEYIKNIDADILYDDNIGMSRRIRLSYDTTKFSRQSMELLIEETYTKMNMSRARYHISLYGFLVHSVEFIFDTSFFINICML